MSADRVTAVLAAMAARDTIGKLATSGHWLLVGSATDDAKDAGMLASPASDKAGLVAAAAVLTLLDGAWDRDVAGRMARLFDMYADTGTLDTAAFASAIADTQAQPNQE